MVLSRLHSCTGSFEGEILSGGVLTLHKLLLQNSVKCINIIKQQICTINKNSFYCIRGIFKVFI